MPDTAFSQILVIHDVPLDISKYDEVRYWQDERDRVGDDGVTRIERTTRCFLASGGQCLIEILVDDNEEAEVIRRAFDEVKKDAATQ